jgi:prevent-host-death family protein
LVNIRHTMQVNIYEAKTRLSELVDQASRGETIIIAKAGTPLAKLVPLHSGPKRKIKFGLMKGEIEIADDFDDPLPEDVLAAFEGRSE